ncbi:MAG: L-serine ammonia-lyase [Erysipelotrichaceae bacterium]|nr:L-serine ammonia-lyase [Erysipelotrichaceae bacterium]
MQSLKQLYKIGHGPSSSHTMGPDKACHYILKKYPQAKKVEVILFGSLALTGKGHLTDKIIYETLKDKNVSIKFDCLSQTKHPNTMWFNLYDDNDKFFKRVVIYSIGGGSIVVENDRKRKEKEYYNFASFDEIKKYCNDNKISLSEFVYRFDCKDIKSYLNKVYKTMETTILNGLHKDGELPGNLHVLRKASRLFLQSKSDESDDERKVRLVSAFAFASSEENASGAIVVTSPTCGACGVLPAVLFYLKEKKKISKEKIIDALAVAGIIGNVIKQNAAISGAFAGCQSEIGSACSMAAAAIAYLNDLNIEEIEYAAEIALEHHLGLTCDPVNGLVQIPCIERNAVAAIRALDAVSLASLLSGTRKVSFDTVVKTMYETGKDLNQNYKETSVGGLAKNYNFYQ